MTRRTDLLSGILLLLVVAIRFVACMVSQGYGKGVLVGAGALIFLGCFLFGMDRIITHIDRGVHE